MKKLIVILTGLFLMTLAVENVTAQSTDDATADAAANILEIIQISKEQDLHFGDIVPSNAAGTVTVSSTGGGRTGTGVTLFNQFTTHSEAEFKVTGEENATYTITLPVDGAITLTGAGTPMDLKDFEHNANELLNGSGEETFQVGATLEVGANQAAGLYEADFDVTVSYN